MRENTDSLTGGPALTSQAAGHGGVQRQACLLQVGPSQGSCDPQGGALPHPEDDGASGKDWHSLHTHMFCLEAVLYFIMLCKTLRPNEADTSRRGAASKQRLQPVWQLIYQHKLSMC